MFYSTESEIPSSPRRTQRTAGLGTRPSPPACAICVNVLEKETKSASGPQHRCKERVLRFPPPFPFFPGTTRETTSWRGPRLSTPGERRKEAARMEGKKDSAPGPQFLCCWSARACVLAPLGWLPPQIKSPHVRRCDEFPLVRARAQKRRLDGRG